MNEMQKLAFEVGYQTKMAEGRNDDDPVADYLSDDPILRILKHMAIGGVGGAALGGLGGGVLGANAGKGDAGPTAVAGALGGGLLGAGGGVLSSILAGRRKRQKALADYVMRARGAGA